jgi:hypothetical protein
MSPLRKAAFLAGLAWNHRGRHDHAPVAERCELAIDAVSTTSGFVTEVELAMMRQPLLAIFAISSGAFGITPRKRTVPFLPSSAMLMEMVALWTSKPMNDLVCITSSPPG